MIIVMMIVMIEDDHSHGDGNAHSYRTFVLSCFPIQILEVVMMIEEIDDNDDQWDVGDDDDDDLS